MATFLKPTVTRCQAHEADNLSDAEALSILKQVLVRNLSAWLSCFAVCRRAHVLVLHVASAGCDSFYFKFLMLLSQKIDVIAADVKGGAIKGKKELWQLSDESEASLPSADDEEAGHDEDVSDDGSVDSDGGGGSLAARKPRPAKLMAVSSSDADRRQQRQVVSRFCLMWCGMFPGQRRSVTWLCRMICALRILGACAI